MATLVCKIELDKLKGATVTIENPDGKITQTVSMDGTTLTMKVEGEKATSTYVQKQDKIHITVDDLIVDAKTISITSQKASSWKSQDVFSAQSEKDMTLKTGAKLSLTATGDAALNAQNISATAKTDAKLEATSTSLKGSASFKAEGAEVKLIASGKAALQGAMISIHASGMLSAESSGVATLKGSITNVQGSLVHLG